jgi:hypothetical protein
MVFTRHWKVTVPNNGDLLLSWRMPSSGMLCCAAVCRLIVMANIAPSSPVPVILMTEALCSSEMSVLTRAKQHNSPEDSILHSHCHENLKSYIFYPHVHVTNSLLPSYNQLIPACSWLCLLRLALQTAKFLLPVCACMHSLSHIHTCTHKQHTRACTHTHIYNSSSAEENLSFSLSSHLLSKKMYKLEYTRL